MQHRSYIDYSFICIAYISLNIIGHYSLVAIGIDFAYYLIAKLALILYIKRPESGKKMRKKINKIGIILILAIMPILIVSCAQTQKNNSGLVYFPPAVSPNLILHAPGEYAINPQTFAYRSDWPSAEGSAKLGQIIYYREYWYNRQSMYPSQNDNSYKLFRGYRVGQEIK